MPQKASSSDLVITAILAIAGAYYLLAPHTLHVSSGLGIGLNHSIHIILGVILLAAGAAYYAKQAGMLKK